MSLRHFWLSRWVGSHFGSSIRARRAAARPLNWWKSSHARRSNSRIRNRVAESLEPRVLLSAIMGEAIDVTTAHDSSMTTKVDIDSHDGHLHGTGDEIYLPRQHRLAATRSFLSAPDAGDPVQIAVRFLNAHADELGLDGNNSDTFIVTSQYTDQTSGQTHIYLRQTFGGLEVMNADISISLTARGEVIHVTSSFVSSSSIVSETTSQVIVNASRAFMALSDDIKLGVNLNLDSLASDSDHSGGETMLSAAGTPIEDVAAKLVYVPTANGLELAWKLDVHNASYSFWSDGFVDATSGETLYVNDRIGHAIYTVFALPTRSPIDGVRSSVVDPHDPNASPFGWHDTNGVAGAEFLDTRGNNASVQEDVNHDNVGGFRPSGGAGLSFDFALNTAIDPVNNQSAAMANAFYWANLLHDIHYQYGFTEAAGNFQVNNYGRGGAGNDPVLIDIQDGDGGGDGFAALPDGKSPRMTLHRRSNPFRDSAFDTEIMVHEYGHGISERLTGGPANTSALNAIQSKAMGEGWGDWWALMLTQKANASKLGAYGIGNYAAGLSVNGPGIRKYPYSFDKSINPLTYNSFNGGAANNESHKAGAIWASALWDMNWLLIDKHGVSSDLMNGNAGNNLALQLVMDGLKLQGTNPSFLAGRDAILAADFALTGGENLTEIWTAFARRGMGFSASDGGGAGSLTVSEAFDLPGSISGTVFRDDDGNGQQGNTEPGLAAWEVYLDQNNNGIRDTAATTVFNSTDTPKGIIDGPKTFSTRVVSGLVGNITDINVTVNISHAAVGELYVTLISPTGTPVILANYLGGSGDNYTNTTFDDEAATYISTAVAPFNGSFRPYYDLAQLDGRNPNGTWTLRLDDSVAGNVGTLLNWSIQITSGDSDPVVVTDVHGDYTFYGVGAGTHYVREIIQPGFTRTSPLTGVHETIVANGQVAVGRDFGNRAAAIASNIATMENTLSSAIIIEPTVNQNITHFRISGIVGGSLILSGSGTPVVSGDFITVAQGLSGVRFLPSQNSIAAGKFDVELSQDGATVVAGSSKATCTITVTPYQLPSLSIGDVFVSESNTSAVLIVTLSKPGSHPVSVSYTTAAGSATVDFTPTSGVLTFAPGETSKPVTVNLIDDLLDEVDETFFVILSNAVSATIGDPYARATIIDDDVSPAFSIDDVSIFEGNAGYSYATFTVTLSAASGRTVSVGYATSDGAAVSPNDYAGRSGKLSFAPGVVSRTISILVKGDSLAELDEFFSLDLSNALNATIADGHGVGWIRNDD